MLLRYINGFTFSKLIYGANCKEWRKDPWVDAFSDSKSTTVIPEVEEL
jgi:hypothetical protein